MILADTGIIMDACGAVHLLKASRVGVLRALARETFVSVLDISGATVDLAAGLMRRYPRLMARDAIHLAVVELNSLDGICSYDRDFDQVAGVRRLEPRSILGN